METPLQTAGRLLTALEKLAEQGAGLLRSLDLVEAAKISERAAPLVKKLCELSLEPGVATLRPRVQELLERRRQQATLLDAHRARLQRELRRVNEARARLARLTPVYGHASGAAESRLNSAA